MPPQEEDKVRDLIRGYATSLREAHGLVGESLTQSDSLLGWNVGLMGAALFATPTLLSALGVSLDRAGVAVMALLPWVAGILFGIGGRLFALELREANDLHVSARLAALDFLLVAADLDAPTLRDRFLEVMRDEGDHGRRLASVKRLQLWTRAFYYATYLALAVGAVMIFYVAVSAARLVLSI